MEVLLIGLYIFLIIAGFVGTCITMSNSSCAKGLPIMLAAFFVGLSFWGCYFLFSWLEFFLEMALPGLTPLSGRKGDLWFIAGLIVCSIVSAVLGHKLGQR